MRKIANILVNIPIKQIFKTYSYYIPEELEFLNLGWRVLVPFGSRVAEGFVMEIIESAGAEELKPIYQSIDQTPWFNENMIATAKWISEYYLCPLSISMRLFIPGKSGLKIVPFYSTVISTEYESSNLVENKVISALKSESLSKSQLKKILLLTDDSLDKSLQRLIRKNLIKKTFQTFSRAKQKYENVLLLNRQYDDIAYLKTTLQRKPAQYKLALLLHEHKRLTSSAIKQRGISADTIKKLLESKIVLMEKQQVLRDSYRNFGENITHLELTAAQRQALNAITAPITEQKHKVFLLHGITGSGKTEIYIQATALVRREGRQVILLVPEIALTSQIVHRFKAHFQEDVIVMHSRLSIEERNDAIQRLHLGEAGIVIGARSAIFSPADQIGLIILDEEHEFAYKQEEAPRYHAREVALQRGALAQAVVLLGSATPSVESYFAASEKRFTLLHLPERASGADLPKVTIVDMRAELKAGYRKILSRDLYALIETTLKRQEQLILLLNRRGFSTFVLCRECGYVLECDHCAVPMVYHNSGSLHCHYCDSACNLPDQCPKCASRYIRYFGTGTQKLEEELKSQFPGAKIIRMDKDTTGGKMSHSEMIHDFLHGKYDILLGTQMVAKGHDFPKVTAVAVLSADSSLNLPDFRGSERCFDLLTQAVGRAGRKDGGGKAVIQAYNPEHYAIQAAAAQDYLQFYNEEIALRKALFYPPYCHLLKITLIDHDETRVKKKIELLYHKLQNEDYSEYSTVIGPFAAAIFKIKDAYRMQLLIKSTEMERVKYLLRQQKIHLREDITIDVDPLQTT